MHAPMQTGALWVQRTGPGDAIEHLSQHKVTPSSMHAHSAPPPPVHEVLECNHALSIRQLACDGLDLITLGHGHGCLDAAERFTPRGGLQTLGPLHAACTRMKEDTQLSILKDMQLTVLEGQLKYLI